MPPARPAILLVEDDAALRRLYRLELELRGYEVGVAQDGMAALQLIDTGPPPHVVVLDLGLPRLSGLAVAADLAARGETSNVPIVVVTGRTEPFNEKPFAAVLHKPLEPGQLSAAVDEALRRRRPQRRRA